MFEPLTVPFGSIMMYNVVKLKEGVTLEDVELLLGEMCNVVKNTYGNEEGGFIGGQVYRFGGFVSDEGSIDSDQNSEEHISIVTYWKSFQQHEKSHADKIFKEKFAALLAFADTSYEIGYEMLWQGETEVELAEAC